MKIFCPVCGEELEIIAFIQNVTDDAWKRELKVDFETLIIKHEHLGE